MADADCLASVTGKLSWKMFALTKVTDNCCARLETPFVTFTIGQYSIDGQQFHRLFALKTIHKMLNFKLRKLTFLLSLSFTT